MNIINRKITKTLFVAMTISLAGFTPNLMIKAHATELAVSADTINYQRDWIISSKVAYELIQKGALVIDARGDDLKEKFIIPNASSITWQDLSEPNLPNKGNLLTDANVINKKLQSLGISQERPIVILGDPLNGWGEDGRIAWTLRTWGHNKVVIVDGGLAAVQKEGPLNIKKYVTGDFTINPTSKWKITKEEIKNNLSTNKFNLFDVREPREYAGKTPYGETRGGHVPGAKDLFYKDFIGKDGKLLPRVELEKILASKGVTKESNIVAYCTGGIRSGWFTTILNDLGYKTQNYAGSMWEWSAQPANEYPLDKKETSFIEDIKNKF
jgi:thiosulfate/3-mercaptopyruvate sulfurtransferase